MRCLVEAPLRERRQDLPASQRTPERPAGKGETHGSPRAPSVVSRSRRSKTRRPTHASSLFGCQRGRAPFRLLSTPALRQAGLGASSGLAPSEPRGLATSRIEGRAMRPTDFCHPNQDDYPRAVRSRLLEPLSRSGTPRDDPWSSRGMIGGQGVFTTPVTASDSSPRTRDLVRAASRPRIRRARAY